MIVIERALLNSNKAYEKGFEALFKETAITFHFCNKPSHFRQDCRKFLASQKINELRQLETPMDVTLGDGRCLKAKLKGQ